MKIRFFVPGVPKPGGSKTGFYNKKLNRVLMVDASKNTDWKNAVRYFCIQSFTGEPLSGSLKLTISFAMPRPQNHYGTGKKKEILKENAANYHISRPDIKKLIRSTEDALTGILWHDDAQIVIQMTEKIYSTTPGAWIVVETIVI